MAGAYIALRTRFLPHPSDGNGVGDDEGSVRFSAYLDSSARTNLGVLVLGYVHSSASTNLGLHIWASTDMRV
eukprot:117741-Rhodomonas_salina.1